MKIKNLFLAFCITCSFALQTLNSNAQTPDWLWAKSAGGSSSDDAYSITADVNGNIFVTGNFASASITFGSFTLTSAGNGDMFLVKYDTQGNVLWANSYGGNGNDYANSVTHDTSGNIFVAGYFASSSITFGSFTLTNSSAGSFDMFLVKYDSLGNVIWAIRAGGVEHDQGISVYTDVPGNIYVAGRFFSSTISFASFILTNAGNCDMFIVKYSNAGGVIWAKSAGGSEDDGTYSVTVDKAGNVFMVGKFASPTIIFDSDTLTNASNPGYDDMFIAKYSANGSVLWAKSAGGSFSDETYSVTSDANVNMFVGGLFSSSTITFDSITLTNSNVGFPDIFIVKYDADGNVIWAKSAGGSGFDVVYSLTADANGDIYVVGVFSSPTITFGSTTLTNDTTSGSPDMFLVKYDNSGNVVWAKSVGGNSSDYAWSVTADYIGNIFVTGWFQSPAIIFDSDTLTNNSVGNSDMFVAKLSSITTGIESVENKISIVVYPNPSTGKVAVAVGSGSINTIEIYNMLGEKVYSSLVNSHLSLGNFPMTNAPMTIDLSSQPTGIYFVKIYDGEKIHTVKIVIQ